MSDDLVKQLNKAFEWCGDPMLEQAADRIEELEAQITAMEEGLTAVHMAGYMDGKKATQAKLEKAVEALTFYQSSCDATDTTCCSYKGNLCCQTARATLAELKGQGDE